MPCPVTTFGGDAQEMSSIQNEGSTIVVTGFIF